MSSEEQRGWLVFATCMLVLFLLVIVSKCINVARLCCRVNHSNSNRNRFEREFVEETIPDEYSIEFPSLNFESSMTMINSIPMCQFKKEEMTINTDCAICLGEFEEGEWLKQLPSCTHGFHVSCIDKWFRSHSNCPLCRSFVSRDLVADTEFSVSLYTLIGIETLSREEFSTQAAAEIPQNLEIGHLFCSD